MQMVSFITRSAAENSAADADFKHPKLDSGSNRLVFKISYVRN